MIGATLSGYYIKDRLGAGGMGEVYVAHDTRLKRDVALKLVRHDLAADPERLARLRREAQTLAALDHPGIVTIFSVEESAGVQFLTMQLVDGTTLDQVIPQTGLATKEFLHIAIQLAEAVAAAHERGVIHRDLKPSNVMLTRDGRVKVLDFGLAKLTEKFDATSAETQSVGLHSNEGRMVGTLPYMSPEQIGGEPIDRRSDLFSLGTLFYEMVSGRRPFSGATPAAVLAAICTAVPDDISQLRSDLPRPLSRVLARCLEKAPDKRIQSARELHAELVQLSNRPDSGTNAERDAGNAKNRAAQSIAVLPFVSLSPDSADGFFADGISEEIINALGRLPDLKVVARTSTFSFKGRSENLRLIGDELRVATVLEGSVRRSGNRLRITAQLIDVETGYHLWSERYDRESADVFDIQDEIARHIASRLEATFGGGADVPLVQAGTSDVEAFRIYAEGRGRLEQRTQDDIRRAVECFERAVGRDPRYVAAWAGLADALLLLEDYSRPGEQSLLPTARQAALRSLEIDPEVADPHASLGLLHCRRHQGPAAVHELNRAVQIRPNHAEAHNWLSWIHLLLGDARQGLQHARAAVELNPLSPEALNHLCFARMANGDDEAALRAAARSIEIQPLFQSSSLYRGLALYHAGSFQEATRVLENLSVPWAGLGPVGIIALAEAAMGNTARAEALQIELQEADEVVYAGLVHAALGRLDRALDALETAARWDYWPTLTIHHCFRDVLQPLRDEPRFHRVLAEARRAWGLSAESVLRINDKSHGFHRR